MMERGLISQTSTGICVLATSGHFRCRRANRHYILNLAFVYIQLSLIHSILVFCIDKLPGCWGHEDPSLTTIEHCLHIGPQLRWCIFKDTRQVSGTNAKLSLCNVTPFCCVRDPRVAFRLYLGQFVVFPDRGITILYACIILVYDN